MDKAVSQQHYAEAEQFRVRLTELGEEKALAAEKEQHASPKEATGKVGCVKSVEICHYYCCSGFLLTKIVPLLEQ